MRWTRSALLGRWKAFAGRAARAQSAAVLWLMYYLILVPIALIRRGVSRRGHAAPTWQPRTARTDAASARRQF